MHMMCVRIYVLELSHSLHTERYRQRTYITFSVQYIECALTIYFVISD